MITIFNYHQITGEFLNESLASLDPIEKKPLIPSFATLSKPPFTEKNKVAIFQNEKWSIKNDHRGVKYYLADGSEHSISEIGINIPDNALLEPPPPSPDDIKATLQSELIALCDSKQDQAEKLLLGYKATPKQIDRYKDKYERALEGEFDAELNANIIAKHESYRSALRSLVDMIELFRSQVDDFITAGEFSKSEAAIKEGEGFSKETTKEDIKALIESL